MKILNTYEMAVATRGVSAVLFSVLVEGGAGQYAVYIAIVPPTTESNRAHVANWVAAHGSKQTFKDAGYFFKGLEDEKYRR